MEDREFVTIGRITKNQGNKGEIRVIPLTDFPERFELLTTVLLVKNEKALEMKIENVRFHKQFVILQLEGINDINAALSFRDYMIMIPEDEVLPLKEGEYYIDDIIGFKVYTTSDDMIGRLREVLTTGGTDVFLVQGKEKEYMIPAAQDIIIEINLTDQEIVIDPIPGLLDL